MILEHKEVKDYDNPEPTFNYLEFVKIIIQIFNEKSFLNKFVK